MNYAINGKTVAELIYERVNSEEIHMGLTNWKNISDGKIMKYDISIAKNYLKKDESELKLSNLTNLFLDVAESEAKEQKVMTMKDWIEVADDLLIYRKKNIFNENTGLKFATSEDDYNVVISFTIEGPNASGKSILLPEKPMVINPLNWKNDDTYASADLNKGMIMMSLTYDSIIEQAGKDDAQINLTRKTVVCNTRTDEDYTVVPDFFATESLHEKEYAMYHANLKENVQVCIDAYFANK